MATTTPAQPAADLDEFIDLVHQLSAALARTREFGEDLYPATAATAVLARIQAGYPAELDTVARERLRQSITRATSGGDLRDLWARTESGPFQAWDSACLSGRESDWVTRAARPGEFVDMPGLQQIRRAPHGHGWELLDGYDPRTEVRRSLRELVQTAGEVPVPFSNGEPSLMQTVWEQDQQRLASRILATLADSGDRAASPGQAHRIARLAAVAVSGDLRGIDPARIDELIDKPTAFEAYRSERNTNHAADLRFEHQARERMWLADAAAIEPDFPGIPNLARYQPARPLTDYPRLPGARVEVGAALYRMQHMVEHRPAGPEFDELAGSVLRTTQTPPGMLPRLMGRTRAPEFSPTEIGVIEEVIAHMAAGEQIDTGDGSGAFGVVTRPEVRQEWLTIRAIHRDAHDYGAIGEHPDIPGVYYQRFAGPDIPQSLTRAELRRQVDRLYGLMYDERFAAGWPEQLDRRDWEIQNAANEILYACDHGRALDEASGEPHRLKAITSVILAGEPLPTIDVDGPISAFDAVSDAALFDRVISTRAAALGYDPASRGLTPLDTVDPAAMPLYTSVISVENSRGTRSLVHYVESPSRKDLAEDALAAVSSLESNRTLHVGPDAQIRVSIGQLGREPWISTTATPAQIDNAVVGMLATAEHDTPPPATPPATTTAEPRLVHISTGSEAFFYGVAEWRELIGYELNHTGVGISEGEEYYYNPARQRVVSDYEFGFDRVVDLTPDEIKANDHFAGAAEAHRDRPWHPDVTTSYAMVMTARQAADTARWERWQQFQEEIAATDAEMARLHNTTALAESARPEVEQPTPEAAPAVGVPLGWDAATWAAVMADRGRPVSDAVTADRADIEHHQPLHDITAARGAELDGGLA